MNDQEANMRLCMLLPPVPDRRWVVARQMGISAAVAKLAPELTGRAPPYDLSSLVQAVDDYRAGGFEIIGLEGDQFDMGRIKLGLPGLEEDLERYAEMVENMGRVGIPLLCFNFMVGVGWHRTATGMPGRGGALVSAYSAADDARAQGQQPARIETADVWENYRRFIRRIAPVAERSGVRMGLHPDDPPVPRVRGYARVLTSPDAIARALEIADSPAVGLTFCQGTFRSMAADVPALVHRFRDHVAFVHVRDVRRTEDGFVETFPDEGETDMRSVFEAYREIGFNGPVRPDHAPAMDGDPSPADAVHGTNVGYEANGMIFTVGYMKGLIAGTTSRSAAS